MRKRNIYTKDWLIHHPYKTYNAVDSYFADLADKVYNIITTSIISDAFIDSATTKDVAIRLTMWFEDLVSEIGIWKAVTSEFKQRYNYTLPFYKLNEYYEEGMINIEDIRFLIWNEMQSLHREMFINPENIGINVLSHAIFKLFEDEWEYAPENERLHAFIHNETITDSYWEARKLIEWFHRHAFVSTKSKTDLLKSFEHNQENNDINPMKLLYFVEIEKIFNSKNNLLSLTAAQWIARIRDEKEFEIWDNIRWKSPLPHAVIGDDDITLQVKNLVTEEIFHIEKESFDDSLKKHRFGHEETLLCSTVSYKDKFFQCGMMTVSSGNRLKELADDYRYKYEFVNEQSTIYPVFIKAFKGRDMVFVGSEDDFTKVFKKIGFDEFKPTSFDKCCAIYCSPINGVGCCFDESVCICDKENPYYDKEYARKNAHNFYFNNGIVEYRLLCNLHDKNLLPDAHINNVEGNEKKGRDFIRKYGSYLIDYFHSKSRKYDYDAKIDIHQFNLEKYD